MEVKEDTHSKGDEEGDGIGHVWLNDNLLDEEKEMNQMKDRDISIGEPTEVTYIGFFHSH